MILTSDQISQNLEDVRASIDSALAVAARGPGEARLLAVSKTWPVEAIRMAAECGQSEFGESRVQEAVVKVPALPAHLDWHFIGHLQKNKIRRILPLCPTLHSVDRLDLARQIDRIAGELGLRPGVFLQINVAGDPAKFGFSPDGVRTDLEALLGLKHLDLLGLMTIPAFSGDPEASRPAFTALRELRDELASTGGVTLPGLSMGMSHDYRVAVEEGATIVRVGTGIFGKRPAFPQNRNHQSTSTSE